MSRSDKTKPFWVKLLHGDLAYVEHHDHTDGRCDLPDPEDSVAFTYCTTQCRREFQYTGTRVCCCDMCHRNDWPLTERQRRRKNRRRQRMTDRDWQLEYETKDPDVDYWIGENPHWYYGDGRRSSYET